MTKTANFCMETIGIYHLYCFSYFNKCVLALYGEALISNSLHYGIDIIYSYPYNWSYSRCFFPKTLEFSIWVFLFLVTVLLFISMAICTNRFFLQIEHSFQSNILIFYWQPIIIACLHTVPQRFLILTSVLDFKPSYEQISM